MIDKVERTKYATVFEEEETGNKLIRSGRVIGNEIIIEEGTRPFPDRNAKYINKGIKEADRRQPGVDTVFEVMDKNEKE